MLLRKSSERAYDIAMAGHDIDADVTGATVQASSNVLQAVAQRSSGLTSQKMASDIVETTNRVIAKCLHVRAAILHCNT